MFKLKANSSSSRTKKKKKQKKKAKIDILKKIFIHQKTTFKIT